MPFTTVLTDSYPPIDESLLAKSWFDYTPEMNEILNSLHKRIFNLEIALQANNQTVDRTHTSINDDLLSRKMNRMITQSELSHNSVRNSIESLSQRSARNSFTTDRHLSLEKQFPKLNISSHVSTDQIITDNIDLSNISLRDDLKNTSGKSQHTPSSLSKLPSLSLTPNQMRTRAYEFVAIFENAFDQLNIIHRTLSINDLNRNNNHIKLDDTNSTNCNPFALNLAGILPMNERDKLRHEIGYFFHILILLFRALLLESQTDFRTSINHIHNHLPSIQLIELNNRLEISQEKITQLSFIKKHFQTEKSQQLNTLNSTKSQLKDYLMEEKARSKVALRYCNDWKTTHILQWIEMLLQTEENYTKTIHQYETILKQTEITHQETIQILTQQNNEIKLNVNKWYEYYQNETYRFERELTGFRQEFSQVKRQRQDMYEEYERMKIIVDEYNQMKINERLLLEKQKKEEEAIKRIQAWWRGMMTRHIKQKRRKKKKKK